MAEAAATKKLFSVFKVTDATMKTYIMYVLEINPTESIITLDKDTIRLVNNRIQ